MELFISKFSQKIPDENLLREKRTNQQKKEFAFKIVAQIKKTHNDFKQIQSKFKNLTNTSIPFFDIEYRTLLKIIIKNFDKDLNEVPPNKEFYILNKNIHIFERLFGFKFRDNKSISAISNQSYFGLEVLYPNIKESDNQDSFDLENKNCAATNSGSIYLEKQQQKKSFHVFSEPSTIFTDAQAYIVFWLD